MKIITEAGDLRGKRVFLRCDFNVPVTEGKIDDDYRIRKALPTINFLRGQGARIILASHIETEGEPTLKPIHEYLQKLFPVSFIEDYYPLDISKEINDVPEGEVILLENLRKYKEEKANDENFAKHLASFADIYIDDAFATAHREHASIVGIPKFIQGFAGLLLADEVKNLSLAFNAPHPFVFVLGGAKFDTKLPLINKFLSLADTIYVGGALANDLLKAKGFEVGTSVISEGFDAALILKSEKLLLPIDVIVENGSDRETKKPEDVKADERIMDAGMETLKIIKEKIESAAFVLWNGPLGWFEKGYKEGTDELAQMIAASSAQSVVGGGDTLSSIASLGIENKFTFVSTGGGAMLDFLANGTLPGVEALK